MKRIGLISDNHAYYGDDVTQHLSNVDEIWHAGDIGSLESIETYRKMAKFIGVYGNIDDKNIRLEFDQDIFFECEGIPVFMTHIGGYPNKYHPRISTIIKEKKPKLFICGHSHICKVVPDKANQLLHMNPGAYGHHGFHKIRTILKFEIHQGQIKNLQVVELGLRGHVRLE